MTKTVISTNAAPKAVGPYSQAVKSGELIFVSGQIPLDPATQQMVEGGFMEQAIQVFKNLESVAQAADSSLDNALKLTVYLTDLANFEAVNEVMMRFVKEPYPARAAIQASALPKGVMVEVDAILST